MNHLLIIALIIISWNLGLVCGIISLKIEVNILKDLIKEMKQ